ncbi:MAG: ABC-type transport auxiliary lipoprotein family protein [Pseudomonadota bacterium]
MKKTLRALFVALAAGTASACVNVLPDVAPPSARYTIPPVTFAGEAGAPVNWSLAIADPTASRAFDTAQIALSRAPGQIEYYANGEWADRSTQMVRLALVRSFENTGRILDVGDSISMPGADYILRTDLRSFQVHYERGAPVVETAIFAKLVNRRGKVLASRLFSQKAPVDRDNVAEVGQAFNAASQDVLREIVNWTLSAQSLEDAAS